MKHSHKEKIEVLKEIMSEYQHYLKRHDSVKVYDCGLNFFIIFNSDEKPKFGTGAYKRKIPYYDLDKVIARYRSKLSHNREKHELKVTKTRTIRNIPVRLLNVKMF